MTRDPRRLLEEGTRSERDLLSSARDDAPSLDAERRARFALGIAAPLMPVPGPEAASPAAAPAAAPAASIAGMKLVAISAAVATIATASWLATRTPSPTPPPTLAPAPVSIPVRVPVPVPVSIQISAPIPAPRSLARPKLPQPTPTPPRTPTLERELELLRSARAHLAASDPMAAEATLAMLREEIPNGELREETAALALETAFALHLPDARTRAEAFLADFPSSPHAPHARALLAEPAAP